MGSFVIITYKFSSSPDPPTVERETRQPTISQNPWNRNKSGDCERGRVMQQRATCETTVVPGFPVTAAAVNSGG
ncbi:hypothetical protein HanRHA438_Chr05g0220281 [Helianthus annuus]|uniref:Uncharacterized protein n=1 Tax=Helianthus annuus TaxID=4232 RepID=A0A9K3IYN1_HELAN|nr:hypothetical protein HanXRQr2_Chr05g0210621 [Helianthus annuus]KAJ0569960.1 hypothetical protein HanHA300_Chr05g0172611 [Helianthus annuus]KAJ0576651.1 hypothetical protein HanIR_Chr05g0226831 [Helianthus annuus]KAJ0584290.1 hypothetical protein HanHA89_Chr05g0186881 [Helianthus annuus]KAJ0749965.1 hypothetical protein HanLR1_Chr05g0176341 [Helianthus annuus]